MVIGKASPPVAYSSPSSTASAVASPASPKFLADGSLTAACTFPFKLVITTAVQS